MDREDFIKEASKIHKGKYDYTPVVFKNKSTKVEIICPLHDSFWQIPKSHLKGYGCEECGRIEAANKRALSKEEFIEKSRKKHGDKYDYSLVDYKNNHTKVCIICPFHGEFWQRPADHTSGKGCRKCGNNAPLIKEDFIEKSRKKHGDKYDYSLVDYKNNHTKVCIVCPLHGEFWQLPQNHMRGQGCWECGLDKRTEERRYTTDEWINKCKKIFGDKYDYSLVNYVDNKTKVKIICNKCGNVFEKIPGAHLIQKQGCPNCFFGYLGEIKIKEYLLEHNIDFIPQKTFDDLKDINKLSYDFYLPKYNLLIEFNGEQHYKPVKHFGGEKMFKVRIYHDKLKKEYAENNKINLLIIDYNEDIITKLEEKLNEYESTL